MTSTRLELRFHPLCSLALLHAYDHILILHDYSTWKGSTEKRRGGSYASSYHSCSVHIPTSISRITSQLSKVGQFRILHRILEAHAQSISHPLIRFEEHPGHNLETRTPYSSGLQSCGLSRLLLRYNISPLASATEPDPILWLAKSQ